jgi:hypothetical protein
MEERYRTALLTTARQEIGTGIQGNVVSGMAAYPHHPGIRWTAYGLFRF